MFTRDDSDSKIKNVEKDLSKDISNLSDKIDRLEEHMQEATNKITDSLDKLNENMYNPDIGLYARLNKQDGRISKIEDFQKTLLGIGVAASISGFGAVIKLVFDAVSISF